MAPYSLGLPVSTLKLTVTLTITVRYPYNLEFDYGLLEGLNKFSINNLGDPFIESNYGVHSREFEVGLHRRHWPKPACMCSSRGRGRGASIPAGQDTST